MSKKADQLGFDFDASQLRGLGDWVGDADGTYGMTPEEMAEWRKSLDAAHDVLGQLMKALGVEIEEADDGDI